MNESRRDPIVRVLGFVILIVIALVAVGITALRSSRPVVFADGDPFTTDAISSSNISASESKATSGSEIVIPAPISTAVPTTLPEPTAEPDYTFGVVERNDGCRQFTNIIKAIMQREQRLEIKVVDFTNTAQMLKSLATDEIDMTLCFDPLKDRDRLVAHVGFVTIISDPYFDEEGQRLQLLVDSRLEVPLQRQQPCLNSFLKEVSFTAADLIESPESWMESHRSDVGEWTDCD